MKILVADDELDMLELLKESFQDYGLQVDSAVNGAKALEAATGVRYDAIVSDVMMPALTGIDLFNKIKEMPLPHPLLFFYSGFNDYPPYGFLDAPLFHKPEDFVLMLTTVTDALFGGGKDEK